MSQANPSFPPFQVALIGFGEAGETFARAGAWNRHSRGWDLLPERLAAMAGCGVEPASDPAEALADAEIVLSLVTADSALPAAQDYAPLLHEGTIWCDMNSVAPETKRAAAAARLVSGATEFMSHQIVPSCSSGA